MSSLGIIIVDKSSNLKVLTVKEYDESELYKKCGFKKADGFKKHTEWSGIKINGQKYYISVYGKDDGKANFENKYDFPPPIDNKLFFGSCALVGHIKNEKGEKVLYSLTIELWEKIYEKLFGGFENLAVTNKEDEEEEDELANVSKDKKTKKGGYLKDGFVVDSDEDEDDGDSSSFETIDSDEDTEDEDESISEDSFNSDDEESSKNSDTKKIKKNVKNVKKGKSKNSVEKEIVIEDIGSELSEESYDYDD
jgi:hypothetical protein